MHIVIDARIINSSTGRYVERLLEYLQDIDTTNRYSVLVPTKDMSFWVPRNPNFTLMATDIKNYSFAEQTQFKSLLDTLKADLVHFCMPQQPILIAERTSLLYTTLHYLRPTTQIKTG